MRDARIRYSHQRKTTIPWKQRVLCDLTRHNPFPTSVTPLNSSIPTCRNDWFESRSAQQAIRILLWSLLGRPVITAEKLRSVATLVYGMRIQSIPNDSIIVKVGFLNGNKLRRAYRLRWDSRIISAHRPPKRLQLHHVRRMTLRVYICFFHGRIRHGLLISTGTSRHHRCD